jgi:hypothetical protein
VAADRGHELQVGEGGCQLATGGYRWRLIEAMSYRWVQVAAVSCDGAVDLCNTKPHPSSPAIPYRQHAERWQVAAKRLLAVEEQPAQQPRDCSLPRFNRRGVLGWAGLCARCVLCI